MKSTLNHSPAWLALIDHHRDMQSKHMMTLFDNNPNRFNEFTLQFEGMLLDYSKNIITDKTLKLLMDLVKQQQVEQFRDAMFVGKRINNTENRAVLHTALRNRSKSPVYVDKKKCDASRTC